MPAYTFAIMNESVLQGVPTPTHPPPPLAATPRPLPRNPPPPQPPCHAHAQSIRRSREADAARLQAEYNRLVQGLVAQGALRGGEDWLANPALPEDVVRETVPGG